MRDTITFQVLFAFSSYSPVFQIKDKEMLDSSYEGQHVRAYYNKEEDWLQLNSMIFKNVHIGGVSRIQGTVQVYLEEDLNALF